MRMMFRYYCCFAMLAATAAGKDASTPNLRSTRKPETNKESSGIDITTSGVHFSDSHRNTNTTTTTTTTPFLNSFTTTTPTHRRTQQTTTTRSILILRVVNNGRGPNVDGNAIRQYVFTDPNSLKAQMMRCSSNTIIFNAAPYGNGGVIDVPVQTSMNADALITAAEVQAAQAVGMTDLRQAANHIMFLLPKINGYFAEAEVGGSYSYFNDENGVALAVMMHEIGHNLGLQHSGVGRDEYGDYSGYMGRSIVERGGPLMCYNAANHWDLGWFGNARRDLGSEGPSTPITITLTAFVSYLSGNTVLVKIGNFFMQFNQALGHNVDTDVSTSNQLVVVQKNLNNLLTSRLAVLDQGGEYNSGIFVVRVCAKRSTSMDISIGRSSTNCGASVSSAPPPPPVPQPSPTNWGNWALAPTAVNNNWWNYAPRPTPSLSTPFTPIFFSNPRPSPITLLGPFFTPTPPTQNWFQAPPIQPTWSWSSTGGTTPTSTSWTCFFGCS